MLLFLFYIHIYQAMTAFLEMHLFILEQMVKYDYIIRNTFILLCLRIA